MAAQDDDTKIQVHIKGREYEVDVMDLSFEEIEAVEDACNAPLAHIDFEYARASRALAWVVLHREDESVTMEQAAKLTLRDMGGQEDKQPAPPTKAKRSAAS